MKIALVYDRVYPWLKGGGEKALLDIALELKQRGHTVHYFGIKLWDGPADIERDGIFLHGVCSAGELYADDGKRTFTIPLRFAVGLFRSLWKFRADPFDLICCTVFPYFSVFGIWAFRILGNCRTPWVLNWLEVWGWGYWRRYFGSLMKGMLGGTIEWLSARCCPHHLVISPLQAKRLNTLLGIDPKAITMIPRGLDCDALPEIGTKSSTRVLYAGRLIDYKNVETVVRAWPAVLDALPDAKLRIIGDGPSSGEVTRIVHDLQIEHAVELLPPFEAWQDVMKEIGEAAVLVQPSVREGQSVVVAEAMAMGTPVIATSHEESAVTDFIEHGQNGLLIHRWADTAAWSQSIVTLLTDSALRAKLINAGLKDARQFDWRSTLIPALENLFSNVVNNSPASSSHLDREPLKPALE